MTNTKHKFFEVKPHSGKKASHLILFLHGYGSNGENMITLANEFAKDLPDAHFISPNAPQSLDDHYYEGYQWFSLENYEPKVIFPQIIRANNFIDGFIDAQLKRLELKHQNLILVGFSQGSMMAMYNSLHAPKKVAGVVAYSGRLILPTVLSDKINSKPPICLIHGTEDPVVPFNYMIEAQNILRQLQIPFEAHTIDGLEHHIDFKGIGFARKFIEKISK
jgi:phospholipase/carboxylesterase